MEKKYIGDIIHENFYDPLVIIGFPYDQGAINVQKSKGSYLGPDAFRRFLSYQDFGVLKNVEEGIDIEKYLPKISDYGNIQTTEITNGQPTPISDNNMSALYSKLSLKLGKCLERNNICFIMGGSKDMLLPICEKYNEIGGQMLVITNEFMGESQNIAYK